MMNFNGYIDTANQFNGALSNSSLTSFYNMKNTDLEKRLDGLDEETKNEVMKHIDEFQTAEQLEMFINQKTSKKQ
jgi:hypothetical protein